MYTDSTDRPFFVFRWGFDGSFVLRFRQSVGGESSGEGDGREGMKAESVNLQVSLAEICRLSLLTCNSSRQR